MDIVNLKDRPDLIPQLVEICFEEWEPVYDELGITRRKLREGFQTHARSRRMPFSLAAVENDEVAGSATVKPFERRMNEKLSPWLSGVVVRPAFRGRGVARALIEAAELACLGMNVRILHLAAEAHAETMYRRLGWWTAGHGDLGGRNVAVMTKLLDHPHSAEPDNHD